MVVCVSLCWVYRAAAANYWVHPSGNLSWESCKNSDDPKSGYCSLATANLNASAGDVVNLKGGTYNVGINPFKSGTENSVITFQSAPGEKATISGDTVGILIKSRNFIKVNRVNVISPIKRLILISNGASYNEIKDCTLDGIGKEDTPKIWDGMQEGGIPCTNNWIHGCRILNTGTLYWDGMEVNDGGGFQIGVPSYDKHSNNNTIENNVFYCGGHHNLETFTEFNVIKNNFFNHQGCMANSTGKTPDCTADLNNLWGNRNIQIYDGHNREGVYNLVEGNRFGASGPPPDDNGGDAFTVTAPKNIIRYNLMISGQQNGFYFKYGANSYSDSNVVYNNTIYNSGRFQNKCTNAPYIGYGMLFGGGSSTLYPRRNVVLNNLFYKNSHGSIGYLKEMSRSDNTVINNFLGSSDPLFINGTTSDLSSLTIPDLRIKPNSPAVDKGSNLTVALNQASNGVNLSVENALFFQDGKWGSKLARGITHFPDWIAVGNPDNIVMISSINYKENLITLASPLTWSKGDKVWLFKKSDGKRVLFGDSPDYGAYEYSESNEKVMSNNGENLQAPSNIRIIN
jgi:hypothetical protein